MRQGRRLALAALAVGAAALAAGCGGESEEPAEEAAAASEIAVTADEYSFELSDTPAAGQATFSLENVGEEPHVLILVKLAEDATAEEAIQAQGRKGTAEMLGELEAGPGETAEGTIDADLTAGNFLMVCPVQTKQSKQPHFALGQQEEFEITE
jgi:hypothetical protein